MSNMSRRAVIAGCSALAVIAIIPAIARDTEIAEFVTRCGAAKLNLYATKLGGGRRAFVLSGDADTFDLRNPDVSEITTTLNEIMSSTQWPVWRDRLIDYLIAAGQSYGI